MAVTIKELINYLKDVDDQDKVVKFGVWNLNTLEFENVSDFEGLFITKEVVTVTTGVIEKEISDLKRMGVTE